MNYVDPVDAVVSALERLTNVDAYVKTPVSPVDALQAFNPTRTYRNALNGLLPPVTDAVDLSGLSDNGLSLGVEAISVFVSKAKQLEEIKRTEVAEAKLANGLIAVYGKYQAKAFNAFFKALPKGEQPLTEKDIDKAFKAFITEMLPFPEKAYPLIRNTTAEIWYDARIAGWLRALGFAGTLEFNSRTQTEVTKTKRKATMIPGFGVQDINAIDAIADHNTFWIGSTPVSTTRGMIHTAATPILNEGIGATEAGKRLREQFDTQVKKFPKEFSYAKLPGRVANSGTEKYINSYFTGVAANVSTTSRAFGTINSFAYAGITRYTLSNPMDERTTENCQLMHGKTFETKQAYQLMQDEIAAKTPGQVKAIHPWANNPKGIEKISGAKGLQPGVDLTKDQRDKLAAAGFQLPPYHFRCRTTVDISEDASMIDPVTITGGYRPPTPPGIGVPSIPKLPPRKPPKVAPRPPATVVPRIPTPPRKPVKPPPVPKGAKVDTLNLTKNKDIDEGVTKQWNEFLGFVAREDKRVAVRLAALKHGDVSPEDGELVAKWLHKFVAAKAKPGWKNQARITDYGYHSRLSHLSKKHARKDGGRMLKPKERKRLEGLNQEFLDTLPPDTRKALDSFLAMEGFDSRMAFQFRRRGVNTTIFVNIPGTGKPLKAYGKIVYVGQETQKIRLIGINTNRSLLANKRTLFHEWGHSFEKENSRIKDASLRWRNRRIAEYHGTDTLPSGELPTDVLNKRKWMGNITGNKEYGFNEIGWDESFIDGYVSKTYGNKATEVASMGWESFASEQTAAEIAVKDLEHLQLSTWSFFGAI